jgi:y4mF family transcriptional regulator
MMEHLMRLRTATDIGAAIRERRRSLRWDQRELAQRVGVGRQWVIDVEKGKPRAALNLVLRTLEVLGIVLRTEAPPPRSGPSLPGAAIDLGSIVRAHRPPKKDDRR